MSNTNSMSRVASTIYAQLGGSRMSAMIGVSSLVYSESMLRIGFKARAKGRANVLFVSLLADDLYEVELRSVRSHGLKVATIDIVRGVYAENLQEVVETMTGLRLSL
jgi:hypothetical protein